MRAYSVFRDHEGMGVDSFIDVEPMTLRDGTETLCVFLGEEDAGCNDVSHWYVQLCNQNPAKIVDEDGVEKKDGGFITNAFPALISPRGEGKPFFVLQEPPEKLGQSTYALVRITTDWDEENLVGHNGSWSVKSYPPGITKIQVVANGQGVQASRSRKHNTFCDDLIIMPLLTVLHIVFAGDSVVYRLSYTSTVDGPVLTRIELGDEVAPAKAIAA